MGVAGDVHAGASVRHRSRIEGDPTQPNLRQVHLFDGELIGTFAAEGFATTPGAIGENITTIGLDTLSLPTGTLLRIGDSALLALTGIRDPCKQIESHFGGLSKRMLRRDETSELVRLTGAMTGVLQAGSIRVGDPIIVQLPPPPHQPLELV